MSTEEARLPGHWGARALAYVRGLLQAAPVRGSATGQEARAADFVLAQLSELGVKDPRRQPFVGARSLWLFLALTFGTAILGHAAYWLLRQPIGQWPAVAASAACFGFAAVLVWREFTFKDAPLRNTLPQGPSQNVVAILPPAKETRARVVFIAHLDSQRVVWWFASDLLTRIYTFLAPIGIYGLILSPGFYALAALLGRPLLSWLGLGLAGLHFLGWFTGMTADLGVYSQGANDNASAIGTSLALGERLLAEPLEYTEVWLAFTGCEESGCDGMRTFLDQHEEELRQALFVDFELVGIGDRLVYLESEGLVRPQRIPAEVQALVERVGLPFGLQAMRGAGFGAFTEMGVVWGAGLQGVCFLALREESPLLPEWHRLTDTLDRLQPDALGRIHALAWQVLLTLDHSSPE